MEKVIDLNQQCFQQGDSDIFKCFLNITIQSNIQSNKNTFLKPLLCKDAPNHFSLVFFSFFLIEFVAVGPLNIFELSAVYFWGRNTKPHHLYLKP